MEITGRTRARPVWYATPQKGEDFEATRRSKQHIAEKLREEGAASASARAVLTVLRARSITVPDATRERILAQKDPERLARWLEKAAVGSSPAEVLGDPS
jgi:hypothetical protein